jgi:predicted O-linked N-acetylglucosamine transferase (SPINDLY family)
MLKSLLAAAFRKRRTVRSGEFATAVAAFRAGDLASAGDRARALLRNDPDHANAWNLLGAIAIEEGDEGLAASHFEQAATLAPRDPEIIGNLAETRRRTGDLDGAESWCRKALEVDAQCHAAMHTLALVLSAQGRSEEACGYFQRLLGSVPDFAKARSGYLFLLNVSEVADAPQLLAEHRRLAQHISVPERWRAVQHANVPDPTRRLRIGYVSADFNRHAASYFTEPVISGHDRVGFEVYCYSGVAKPDEITERFRALAANWRDVTRLSDEAFADSILADGIDLLVDLSGHTRGNRMEVFARRPAPLQLTWFGYPGTTGLPQIDYKITDAVCDPPGVSDAHYSEKLLRLPDIMYCYQPPSDMPDVSELPAQRKGFITFAAMNGAARLTSRWIALWADLLGRVPASRLVLAAIPAGATHARMHEAFAGHGVDPVRIAIHDRLPYQAFWSLHRDVDIALDTYPCNGGTTTCETLWLGIPVVSYAGDRFGGNRLGASMLTSLGMQELVAATPADYVAIAVRLASDPRRLADLRSTLRQRMRAAPLTDRQRFMRNLEQAYRSVWRAWCSERKL